MKITQTLIVLDTIGNKPTRRVYVTNQEFVFVPYWVETVFIRNGLELSSCLDYQKSRQVLSLEDMSGFLALQDIKKLTREESGFTSGTLFSMWNKSVPEALKSEFNQAVVPMSRSTELKIEVLKRFEDHSSPSIGLPGEEVEEPVYYKLIDIGNSVTTVIFYKGFDEFIIAPDNQYKFVVDQLKTFYVYLKSYQVSELPIFKTYLHLLASKINTVT